MLLTSGKLQTAEEAVLKENLVAMRDALDRQYADAGPRLLDELVVKRYRPIAEHLDREARQRL